MPALITVGAIDNGGMIVDVKFNPNTSNFIYEGVQGEQIIIGGLPKVNSDEVYSVPTFGQRLETFLLENKYDGVIYAPGIMYVIKGEVAIGTKFSEISITPAKTHNYTINFDEIEEEEDIDDEDEIEA